MIKIGVHTVWLNSLKKTGAIFLVFILMLIQIPDALWQQLHIHEHHDCGKPNVVHQYTPDCNLEQRFVWPWEREIIIPLSIVIFYVVFIININVISIPQCSKFKLTKNKSPPSNNIYNHSALIIR